MKKSILTVFTALLSIIISSSVWGQAPEKFNYQAVLRNNGDIMVNEPVNARFTIHDGSATGTDTYQETQVLNTDKYGHINCAVEDGNVVSGDFSTVDWGSGEKYLQVEIDYGSGYEDLGASQLLSVPYALQAGEVDGGNNSWSVNGNSANSTDYIGTNNNQLFRFKVDGLPAGFISPNPTSVVTGTPAWNNAFGSGALQSLTSGISNTAMGNEAMKSTTEGRINTGIGALALSSNITGDYNTALGFLADVGAPDLENASAIGYRAFVEQDNSLVLGSINGVNGGTADTRVGIGTTTPNFLLDVNGSARINDSLYFSTTFLTANGLTTEIGALSFSPISSFSGVTTLGSGTRSWKAVYTKDIYGTDNVPMATNTLNIKSNAIITYDGVSDGSNGNEYGLTIKNTHAPGNSINFQVAQSSGRLLLANTDGTTIGLFDGTSGNYTSTSDERLKTNFKGLDNTLSKIMKLEPLSYNYKSKVDGRQYIGFKAQDVEKIFPSLVYSPNNEDGEGGTYTMNYSGFGVIAVKAIQEQQEEIETLKEQNIQLQSQIDEIKDQLQRMTK